MSRAPPVTAQRSTASTSCPPMPRPRAVDATLRTSNYVTEGKVFVYKAEVGSHGVAARTVQQLIERFCHGSAEQFLMGMVDEKVLTLGQLQRLVRKVAKRK
jgi:Penicillinase repressor